MSYNPSLSEIVNVESIKLPTFLNGELDSFLTKVFYKDFISSISSDGSQKYISISLIFYDGFEIKLFGEDSIELVLFPNANNSTQSIVEMELKTELIALKYLNGFKSITKEPLDASFYVSLISKFAEFSILDLLDGLIFNFHSSSDQIQSFIDKLNSDHSLSPPIVKSTSSDELVILESLMSDIQNSQLSLLNVCVDDYILPGDFKKNITKLFDNVVDGIDFKSFYKLLIPKIDFSVNNLSAGVKFPTKYLKKIDSNNIVIPNEQVILYFDIGSLDFSTKNGIQFNSLGSFSISRAKITGTELVIEFSGVKMDLSKNRSIPEVDSYGVGDDFMGCFITEGTIGFPANWNHDDPNSTAEIKARNLLIGTGGISGTLGMEAKSGATSTPLIKVKFGNNFEAQLDAFQLTFQQNSIVESEIFGKLKIPNFKDTNGNDAEVDIDVFIGNDGEFRITARETDGIQLLEIPDVLKIKVNSLEIGKKNDKFYAAVSGLLDITAQIEGIETSLPKKIGIKKLLIWEDGKIEIEGGALTLPKAVTVKIGPVKLSVSAILLGSHEGQRKNTQTNLDESRQYNFFGFDGAMDINPGGVSASGNGVKFYYTTDTDVAIGKAFHAFMRVDGIGIDIKIPGDAKSAEEAQLMLKGYLAAKNAAPTDPENGEADPGREYVGSVSFAINKANIRGQAGMRLNPDKPSFIVDVGLTLASPIPLGTTGLGIWGFRGLFGKQYLPDRQDEESWWEYYKRPDEGINVQKFESVDKGFSVGVGALIATKDDKGKAFSSKVFLMLGLPDVFLISGQAAIMKDRVGFESDDPPFSALLAINKEGVMANFGVNYKSPTEGSSIGSIATIKGEAELAFFFNNAGAWYINIGKDTPDTERIQARVLSLFDMYAYFMLSAKGIKMGAGASYEFHKKFGPAKIDAYAFIDLAARVGFKPGMIGGSIALGGGVKASLFRISVGFDVFAMLAAEAWRPFIVTGAFDLKIKVPLKRKPIKVHAELTWIFNKDKDLTPFEILEIGSSDTEAIKAVHMLTEQSFGLATAQNNAAGDTEDWKNSTTLPKIPMDSFIDIELSNTVKNSTTEDPNNGLFKVYGNVQGSEYVTISPPRKGKSKQVKHESEILELKISYLNGTNWETYHPYKFISGLGDITAYTTDLDKTPVAYWQMLSEGKNNRLRILSQNMFSTLQKAIKGTISTEGLGFKGGIIKCAPKKLKPECINWEEVSDSTSFTKDKNHYQKGVKFITYGGDIEVKTQSNSFSLNKGVELQDAEIIEFLLPEPCTQITPKLSTVGNNKVIVSYYENIVTGQDHNGFDIEEFELVKADEVQGSGLDTYQGYDDISTPIEKITIQVIVSTAIQTTNTNDMLIGMHPVVANGVGYRNEFSVDDVKLYMRDLSTSEIDQLYKSKNVDKGIVFDQKLDGSLTDSSTLNNTATYTSGSPTYTKNRDKVSNKALYLKPYSGWGSPLGHVKVDHAKELSLDEESYAVSFWFKGTPMMSWNYDRSSHSKVKMYYPIINKMDTQWGEGFAIYGMLYADKANHQYTSGITFRKTGNGKSDSVTGWKAENKATGIYSSMYGHVLDGMWHHIVIRCNHKTELLEMYIDNVLIDSEKPDTDHNVISHNAYLHELCYLTQEKHAFNIEIPDQQLVDEEIQKMQDARKYAIQPVWRPNTKYFVELKTNDKVDGSDNIKYHKIGFETDGPTGHFQEHDSVFTALENEKREDEYAIATLKPYINYDVSYPNPDGQMDMAKPLFYKTPKLNLFFNDGFAYALFNDWKDDNGNVVYETKLKLTVKDPEDTAGINALEGSWVEKDGVSKLGIDDLMIGNLLGNGPNCSSLTNDFDRKSYYAEYVLPDLKPSKLYTSIYDANNKVGANDELKRAHSHVFNTSRYGDFSEQIQSFVLGDDNGTPILANFTKELTLDAADLTLASSIVNGTGTPTEDIQKEFPTIFDRLMDGALKTASFEDSISTEVTLIKDTTSNTLIGLLIRNPEPFIDPRIDIPSLETNNSIKPIEISIDSGGTPIAIDKLIYNKDKSKVFATIGSLNIPTGAATITFKYPEFDGSEYAVNESDEIITLNISN